MSLFHRSSLHLGRIGLLCLMALLAACGADTESPGSGGATSSSSSSSSNGSSNSSSSSSSSSSSNTSSSGFPREGYREGEHILGMDISYWSEQLDRGATYAHADGNPMDLLDLFKSHGINYIRLRTFVDPWAQYGYASNAACTGKSQPYNGKEDIVRMAKRIKAAGMGFLLDFHYSDTWADPSKQVIPEGWRNAQSIDELASEVGLYTRDVLEALSAVNALPDMVQIGNEITPGMLIHVPTDSTDCWGNNGRVNSGPTGQSSDNNWHNLARLLKAGINAVNEVDAEIKTVLHIENTEDAGGVEWWVNSAFDNSVEFDVLALSAYTEFQGPSSNWRSLLNRYASNWPELQFVIAEYNGEGRLLNDIMQELPDGRGLGTFFWEPTESGFWGDAIFTRQGNTYQAIPQHFDVFDGMVSDYGLRRLP